MDDYEIESRRPFSVIALSATMRGAIVEAHPSRARCRAMRALRQVGTEHLGADFPENRTRFLTEARDSYAVHVAKLDLTIAFSWLHLRRQDESWPAPTIVSRLGRMNEPVRPYLLPDPGVAQQQARRWIGRGANAARVLVVPASMGSTAPFSDPELPTIGDVIEDAIAGYSAIEEVIHSALAPGFSPARNSA